ncbi:hypothetical protein [Cupriavidus sp. USMAA2-4]|uniref:hypothetical protein n=1 Tax=Cupriavidus sp. USMAA2-4 TaxID=876364 RepID=UPI0012F4A88D|nr:hypothetical protein [Cupriavidus sp. USMAA2-4]
MHPSDLASLHITYLFGRYHHPAAAFRDLYHQRWRPDEAFQRSNSQTSYGTGTPVQPLTVGKQEFGAKGMRPSFDPWPIVKEDFYL